MTENAETWIQNWTGLLGPAGRLLLIVAGAWLLRKVVRALINQLGRHEIVPAELVVALKRAASFIITTTAVLLILDQLGVSATVLWTAITGFVAVAAVAFFAAWSVLSNIFCTVLIVTTRPFRINDYVELIESADKPGLRGQVIDVNLIYTTLREDSGDGPPSVLQIPNNLFFQRTLRRWRGVPPPAQLPARE